jgi:hypothetical protein
MGHANASITLNVYSHLMPREHASTTRAVIGWHRSYLETKWKQPALWG